MGSQHGRRHDVRQAKLGKAWATSRPIDGETLRRLALKTGKIKFAMNELGKVIVTFKANFEAFRRELEEMLAARERSHGPTELP